MRRPGDEAEVVIRQYNIIYGGIYSIASIRDKQCNYAKSFRDPGQRLQIRDCPGDSGTVGAYVNNSQQSQPMRGYI